MVPAYKIFGKNCKILDNILFNFWIYFSPSWTKLLQDTNATLGISQHAVAPPPHCRRGHINLKRVILTLRGSSNKVLKSYIFYITKKSCKCHFIVYNRLFDVWFIQYIGYIQLLKSHTYKCGRPSSPCTRLMATTFVFTCSTVLCLYLCLIMF